MDNIIKKLNEIDENPLMKKEVKKLCRAYAAEVVRYFEARRSHRIKDLEGGGGAVDDRGPVAGIEPAGDPDDDHVGPAAVAYTKKGRQADKMTCRADAGWKGSRILTGAVRKFPDGIVDGDFPAGYPFIGSSLPQGRFCS